MKTIKTLAIAMMALLMAASCSDITPGNNYKVYQDAVNKTVKKEKKSDKVILLVAFGSTWQQAFEAFDGTVAAYKSKFSGRVKTVEIYFKPEEKAVYYVVNSDFSEKIVL